MPLLHTHILHNKLGLPWDNCVMAQATLLCLNYTRLRFLGRKIYGSKLQGADRNYTFLRLLVFSPCSLLPLPGGVFTDLSHLDFFPMRLRFFSHFYNTRKSWDKNCEDFTGKKLK